MKRFGKTAGPTKEQLQDEAMAELRRTSAAAAPGGVERPLPPSPTTADRPAAWPNAHVAERSAVVAGTRHDIDMDPEPSEEPLDDETPLTPEEERLAVTEFALLQLAEREGREAMPEDLIFEPADPFAAETARNVALQRFFDQQAQRQHGEHRHIGQNMSTGNRREPQRASTEVKWTVGSRPRAVPQEEATPAEATQAKAAPAAKRTTKAAPAAKRTAKAAPAAKAAQAKVAPAAKRTAKANSAKVAPAAKRTAKANSAKAAPAAKAVPGRAPIRSRGTPRRDGKPS